MAAQRPARVWATKSSERTARWTDRWHPAQSRGVGVRRPAIAAASREAPASAEDLEALEADLPAAADRMEVLRQALRPPEPGGAGGLRRALTFNFR